jgi:hypothetical protein
MSSSELTSALALDPGPLAGKIARRSRIRATSRATGARASSSAARRASSSAPMARPAFGRLQPARATSRRRPCAVSTRSLFARQGLHLRRFPGLSRSSACIISSPSFDISISPSLRHSHSSRRSLNFCRPSCAISTQSVPSNLLDLPPFRHLAPLWTISSICSFRDLFLHLTVIPTPEHTDVPSSSET